MNRQPLPNGYRIKMPNGAVYTINHLIGEGGFSFVYSSDTAGGTASAVIKEFFPVRGAFRNKDGIVLPVVGNEENFRRNLTRFENEGFIGGKVSEVSFQTIAFLNTGTGYAVMKHESKDMQSVSDLVKRWRTHPPTPFTGSLADCDPIFPDMVRVRYALRIIESVLVALEVVHNNGYLHLDISGHNVIWAGHDVETGEHCEAFLADFGCSVKMDSGEYHPEYPFSYSPGFAAPEVQQNTDCLTPATDLYSVGVLLFYLCVGEHALEITHNRKRQIHRETAHLAIPKRILADLQKIITTATSAMPDRYQTVSSMLKDVRTLRNAIPVHPLNPDNTKAFTLYSLKSMLIGSEDSHYSWADELQDRMGVDSIVHPESIYSGLSWKTFDDDESFLQSVLSEEIYAVLMERIAEQPNRDIALKGILSCNYDFAWKRDICRRVQKYGTRRLLETSRSLLNDEKSFFVNQRILFQLLSKEGERLRECYYNCNSNIRKAPYVGLAMFTLFALLGPDGFKVLLPSPSKAGDLFFAL